VITPCSVVRFGRSGNRDFSETDIEKYLQSSDLKKIQEAFKQNERPLECRSCWEKESLGIPSLRIPEAPATLNSAWQFTEIHLKLNSVCNFKCRMCGPYSSTAWQQENRAHGASLEGTYDIDKIVSAQHLLGNDKNRRDLFERVIPNTRLIRISGGEPLLSAESLEFFRELIARGLNEKHFLLFTNLSSLTFAGVFYPDFWKQFPKLRLIVSCDGAGASVEYSRTGLRWQDFLKNLQLVRDRIRNVNCVVNIYSIYSIPELVRLCFEYNIDVHIEPVFREEMSVQILPLSEKLKIKDHYDKFMASSANEHLPKEIMAKMYSSVNNLLFAEDLSSGALPRVFKARNEALDFRRGTRFSATFPDLAGWYGSISMA